MNDLIDILDIIGVVAFAISGAMTAIKKRMDLLGVCVLGIVTAVGGGITRDVLLGNTPPAAFKNPRDVSIAAIVSCLVFIFMIMNASEHAKNPSEKFVAIYEYVLMLTDAVGLGAFTVIGIDVAKKTVSDYNTNTFLLIFVGVITGVGGGVLRDIMSGMIPYIFKKHIYAVASAAGAGAYIVIDNYIGSLEVKCANEDENWEIVRAESVYYYDEDKSLNNSKIQLKDSLLTQKIQAVVEFIVSKENPRVDLYLIKINGNSIRIDAHNMENKESQNNWREDCLIYQKGSDVFVELESDN